ncbi:MAG: flagellar biosynthesis protein FlhA [Bacteroidetes bacterium]|nr:flagellar biosynthesis protein FlhA [Bacteroidota bacterium]
MAKNQQLAVFNAVSNNATLQKALPRILKNKDVVLAFGIIFIVCFMIIPMPAFMLDVFITISFGMAILITLISLYIRTPLDFSSFPTVLLTATLFRLALNVASTRLILGDGHAGNIINAFGSFVIGGNFVVGIIVFIILLIINFVVIIKGSTRIAEVSARFTLDAMPGKQMSIDADLNSGFIDEQTARARRERLSHEADFFGSMDGAAKFVKGDAIAGLIITAINIIGGFAIGVLQMDLEIVDATSKFTILSVGDGLVSQIPSLLISVSAGLVVTRAAGNEELSTQLVSQFTFSPKPLAITGIMLIAMGLLPDFPFLVFLVLGGTLLTLAYFRYGASVKEDAEKQIQKEIEQKQENESVAKAQETPVEGLLKVDPLEIELGYALISLVDEAQGGDIFKRITTIRKQLASELGIIIPPVRVRDNLQLEPEEYVIKIRNNQIARDKVYSNMLLAMNSGLAEGKVSGIDVEDPVFGLPATWIGFNDRENAEIKGYTVVEPATVLATHFTEMLKQNAAKLLTRQDVRKLLDNLKEDYPVLLEEVASESLPLNLIQKILQNLLIENIPVRDLPLIIEAILEYAKVTKNVDVLTEYVRHNLSEQIKKLYADQNGVVHCISLSPVLEDAMTNSLQANNQNAMSITLGLPPNQINTIKASLTTAVEDITVAGYMPIVICSAQVRPYFYRMVHTSHPVVTVISYTELPADTDIEVHAKIDV